MPIMSPESKGERVTEYSDALKKMCVIIEHVMCGFEQKIIFLISSL
jgi:hypothetical protein